METTIKIVTDPFDYLIAEHRIVHELFKQIEQADDTYTREELIDEIKNALDFHAEMEEATIYPALEGVGTTKELAEEAEEEHAIVKSLLAEMGNVPVLSDNWEAKLTVLKEMVEHHVEEEEGSLFPEARRSLSDMQIEELGDEMNQFIDIRT
jgi:hemerythrin-like domain-containing protein